MVQATPHQLEAEDWLGRYGRPHPRLHRMQTGYSWELRNVSTGQKVETGHEQDEEDAEDAAARAKERAEDADAARVLIELGGRQE
jgi:hypothetical protein